MSHLVVGVKVLILVASPLNGSHVLGLSNKKPPGPEASEGSASADYAQLTRFGTTRLVIRTRVSVAHDSCC